MLQLTGRLPVKRRVDDVDDVTERAVVVVLRLAGVVDAGRCDQLKLGPAG